VDEDVRERVPRNIHGPKGGKMTGRKKRIGQ